MLTLILIRGPFQKRHWKKGGHKAECKALKEKKEAECKALKEKKERKRIQNKELKQNIHNLSAKDLKKELEKRGISVAGCFEKQDLVQKLLHVVGKKS